jgi:non-specific serine/threonine protein kinase
MDLLGASREEAITLRMQKLADSCSWALEGIALNGSADHFAATDTCNTVSADLTAGAAGPPPQAKESAAPAPNALSAASDTIRYIFRQRGEFWDAAYNAKLVRLKQVKGLTLIAQLLRHPYREFHAMDLAALAEPPLARTSKTNPEAGEESDLGPVLDAMARQSYRQRLQELRQDLEEARSFNDLHRASSLEEEMQFLTRELARAVGLRGRDRKAGSPTERARLRVTNAIKLAIGKISQHHDTLGRHLARNIRTGTFCSYAPDSDARVEWEL